MADRILRIGKCEIIQLLCFDLGERINLDKTHDFLMQEEWVDSSYFGDNRNLEEGNLLGLYCDMEGWWSDYYLEERKFLRFKLTPCSVRFPGSEKSQKMDVICTFYQTGFASIALWIHYRGKSLPVNDVLAYDENDMAVTCFLPQEILTTSEKEMDSSDLQDTIRVFLHNKIRGTHCSSVQELENDLREKSTTPYTYFVVLETDPSFDSPDELVEKYPFEIAGLAYAGSEWKYERREAVMGKLSEDVAFPTYEKFYVNYYNALELHATSTRRYLEGEAKKDRTSYSQQLRLHILDSLIDIELYNYLFALIQYLNRETSRYIKRPPPLEKLTEKIKDILIDIEEYYDVSFEETLGGKEYFDEFKSKMRIDEMFDSLEMKISYLRTLAESQFQISAESRESKITRRVSILTVILTLAVFSEVLIGYAQINASSQEPLVFLAFLLPIFLVSVALFLLFKKI